MAKPSPSWLNLGQEQLSAPAVTVPSDPALLEVLPEQLRAQLRERHKQPSQRAAWPGGNSCGFQAIRLPTGDGDKFFVLGLEWKKKEKIKEEKRPSRNDI